MPEFLTFTLAAPLAAMGELAVGEQRRSWDRPGRSSVLGLLAACLGLDRADEEAHAALEQDYGLALRVESLGPLLADYHTAQVPPARRARRFATRAEELAAPDLETILSRRDYRAGLICLVALWAREASRWPLSDIETALATPCYVPYLGRKSCPLMLPLAPRRIEAANPAAALAARAAARPPPEASLLPRAQQQPQVTMDAADAHAFNLPVARTELRRDRLASRHRWQFALREEAVLTSAQ
jgi:CRISPR system Cascade subunit CasD